MNLRYEKPIFQYIEKKVSHNSVTVTQQSLGSKAKRGEKSSEIKNLDIPALPFEEVENKENMSEPIIQRESVKAFRSRHQKRKQTVDTLLLYDRIDKKPIAVNITYVERLNKHQDVQSIEVFMKSHPEDQVKEQGRNSLNSLNDLIKEGQKMKRRRMSASSKKNFSGFS